MKLEPDKNDGNYAERWLIDSLQVLKPAFAAYQTTVDMTHALQRLETWRRAGIHATPTALLIRAAARALAANPSMHRIVAGSTRPKQEGVDIGLSVSGETFVAPVLVIENADCKDAAQITAEISTRAAETREADRRKLRSLRRWGWLLPFGFLRRAMMRALFSRASFRRKAAGTFQISTVPVDWAATSVFVAAGVLVAGQILPQVLPVDGEPVVRPAITLTLSGNHAVWDGRAAARFLAAVKTELLAQDVELADCESAKAHQTTACA